MPPRSSLLRFLLLVLAALLVGFIPFTASEFWLSLLTTVAVFSLAVIGLNVLTGMAGQVSFGTTAFMACGGYAAAIITTRYHQNPWVAIVAGALISGVCAAAIGYPMLRLQGHYLALGTFALALAATGIAKGANFITGGPVGIPGVPSLEIGPVSLASPKSFYALVWLLVALCLAATYGLRNSRVGRAWLAIATREDVSSSLGIDVRKLKVLAFVFASVTASVSGSLYVVMTSFMAPNVFSVDIAIQVFAMLFVGGVGTLYGPLVGSAVIVILPALFTSLQSFEALVSETILLLIIIVAPRGLGKLSGSVGRTLVSNRYYRGPGNG